MNDDVSLTLLHLPYSTAVGQGELTVARETAEDRYDVLGGFVGLVYDDYSPLANGAEQGRIRVLDHAVLQDRLEH